jgi:hypothetical protein
METRRRAIARLAAAGAAASIAPVGLGACGSPRALSTTAIPPLGPARSHALNARPFVFLERMMDLYYGGSTLRLVQSFVPTPALNLGDLTFTYDNAVMICALLARGDVRDLARARVLGDSLVYAQAHDPFGDGRIRSAYYVHPFIRSNGVPNFESGDGFDVGNTAWTGLALMKLFFATKDTAYLMPAQALGNWIYNNAWDTHGAGGYTGGLNVNGTRIRWKSTEHNIDTFAFFTMLATATNDDTWTQRAAPALAFVDTMWNAAKEFYWIGSLDDGVSANTIPIPEDVQSWSFLGTQRSAYAASIDWAYANLSASDNGLRGVSFSNADRSGVWFEGTAHMAAALKLRNGPGDAVKAAAYLRDLARAEQFAPHTDGYGIDAASKNGLRTGDGDSYFAALHVGATAWYAIAEYNGNPFVA